MATGLNYRDCTFYEAKTKALISCTVDLRLCFRICKKPAANFLFIEIDIVVDTCRGLLLKSFINVENEFARWVLSRPQTI